MHVIVFDNGDPDRVELIGPFGSAKDAQDWALATLDPLGVGSGTAPHSCATSGGLLLKAVRPRPGAATRSFATTPNVTPEALDILQRALQRGNISNPRRYLEKIIANLAGRSPAPITLAPGGRPSNYVDWNARSLRKRATVDEATALGQLRQF